MAKGFSWRMMDLGREAVPDSVWGRWESWMASLVASDPAKDRVTKMTAMGRFRALRWA